MQKIDFTYFEIEISFYGKIYNIEDIKSNQNLDSKIKNEFELLLALYQKYSFDFLKILEGVFSFCIYDKKQNLFFCARDRYGNVPLFYSIIENNFYFSINQKTILENLVKKPSLNKVALSKYMQYFVSFGEDSFYTNIKKLENSSYLIYKNNQTLIKKYYKINTYKAIKDEKKALKDIEELLYTSIEKRGFNTVSCLLSGGIDSSLLATLYTKISGKKINTFSLGYSEYKNYCELDFANIVVKDIKSNHHEIVVSKNDFISSFYEMIDFFDEPHGDSASISLNILFEKISSLGIKDLISGEGSDEIFLGYESYAKFKSYYDFEKTLQTDQREFLDEIVIALQNNTKESEYLRRVVKKQNIYNSFGEVFNDMQKRRLFNKVPSFKLENPKQDCIDWMSYIDLKIWLGDSLLSKVHQVSNKHSLQVHTPFLDSSLVNYMFSVDSTIKLGDTNKYLLKKIASKYIPQTIIDRSKKGFNSPFNEWLFLEFNDEILNTILFVNKNTNLFKDEYLKTIYNLAKQNKFKQHLYLLFIFSLWYKKAYLS